MSMGNMKLAIALAVGLVPNLVSAQHEGHQTAGTQASSPELTQCLRGQTVIEDVITAATARAEAARLSNGPAELRAAIDTLETALRDIRAQSAPCVAAAASSDPHTGHTMPGMQAPSSAPSTQAAAGTPDPHGGHTMAATNESSDVEAWLKGYDVAFNAKDLDKLASFYHPDVTIYEGGSVNNGWIDYRDNHLGPELKSFQNLQFGHNNTKVMVLPGGECAYATSEYFIKAKIGEGEIDSRGLETLILLRGADGNWKIRHSHTSSRPARRPGG